MIQKRGITMKIYDQHVHTFLSHDSNELMENYLDKLKVDGVDTFVSTEHLEVSTLGNEFDVIPDFKLQQLKLEEMGKKYDINMLMGVEVGYRKSAHNRIEEIVESNHFDLVLLSIHNDEEVDVASPTYQRRSKTRDEIYDKYLDLCIYAVTNYKNYDVFAHVEYMIRYMNGDIDLLNHKQKLTKLFKILIEDEKSLEINTRFIYRGNNTDYLKEILAIYRECGGEIVSVGSDCHMLKDFYGGFDVVLPMLKKRGFPSVRVFHNRQPIDLEIED